MIIKKPLLSLKYGLIAYPENDFEADSLEWLQSQVTGAKLKRYLISRLWGEPAFYIIFPKTELLNAYESLWDVEKLQDPEGEEMLDKVLEGDW